MKELDDMTPCQCGHPLWCHATSIRLRLILRGALDVPPYVRGEPDECNHIGPGGWDCDCLVFVLHPYRDQMAACNEKWGGGHIGGGSAYHAAMAGEYEDSKDYSYA